MLTSSLNSSALQRSSVLILLQLLGYFCVDIWYLGVRRENVEDSDVLSIYPCLDHTLKEKINGPLGAQVPVLGICLNVSYQDLGIGVRGLA